MHDDLNALEKNKTCPPLVKPIVYKWIYPIKLKDGGTLDI